MYNELMHDEKENIIKQFSDLPGLLERNDGRKKMTLEGYYFDGKTSWKLYKKKDGNIVWRKWK